MSDEYSYRDFFRNRRENGLWTALKEDHERTNKGLYVILGISLSTGLYDLFGSWSYFFLRRPTTNGIMIRGELLGLVGISAGVLGGYTGARIGRFLRHRWYGSDRKWNVPGTSENVSDREMIL